MVLLAYGSKPATERSCEKMSAIRDDEQVLAWAVQLMSSIGSILRTLERHVKELEHTYEKVLAC